MTVDVPQLCPAESTLLAFCRGELPLQNLEEIELHLTLCEDCNESLSRLESVTDGLIDGLKRAHTPSPRLRPGTVVGEYEIQNLLGRGGMAEVWQARHRRMNREVAIKVIAERSGSAGMLRDRFQREMEVLAGLQHPNIAVAYDAGEFHGSPYLVMELLQGRDLSRQLQEEGPLTVAEAREVILQAARGLAYAHERGLVHRDVKPANLFRCDDGTIKILDLGLVRREVEVVVPATESSATELSQRDTVLTSATTMMGTLDYAAPEQMSAAAEVDGKADVYSLGCTFYALLAGKSPFARDTAEATLKAHRTDVAASLHEIRPDVPLRISKLVAMMLVKDADQRCPSMVTVISELEPTQRKTRWGRWLAVAVMFLLSTGLLLLYRPRAAEIRTPEVIPLPAASRPAKPSPQRMTKPLLPLEATRFQMQYAEDLGVPVKETNTLGMDMILIPSGLIAELKLSMESPIRVCSTDTCMLHFRTFVKETGYQSEVEKNKCGHRPALLDGRWVPKQDLDLWWDNPGYEAPYTDVHPVVQISWNDAMAFCEWLSKKEGCRYRLPTVREHEWYAKCGTSTTYYFGNDELLINRYEVTKINGYRQPTFVARCETNPWGLFDTLGNVRVWTSDWSDSSKEFRSTVGGSFLSEIDPRFVPTDVFGAPSGYGLVGFRVVKELTPP
ncbi:hypothetical protein BH11PLA2_BH11PLA2_53030 [soil metagenome]